MAHKIFRFALVISVVLSISACSYQQKYEGGPKDYGTRKAGEYNEEGGTAYGLKLSGGDNHNNSSMHYSQSLSDLVTGIDGVGTSVVMLTDRNAYVAIVIDLTATGTIGNGESRETDNRGNSLGMYNTETGSSYADPNFLVTGINSYYTIYDHEQISGDLKQRIAEALRRKVPHVMEVHISANRDFINQMNVYSIEARKGHSLRPYVQEFNQVATRFFGVKP
jgi:YhcN/YlaJ family sporulation lipoprotein